MLLTKLHIPPVGINIVHRTVLFEKLNSGLSRKLILVSAPAGYGKTTLLSDWIGRNNIPAAWLSVDDGDNDPALFLNYIITAIQNIQCDFGKKALQLLNSPGSLSVQSIAGLLINDLLGISKDFLLVLDDFHHINNGEVLNLVSMLLHHAPDNFHVTLLTRSDPALSISRLRSRHQIVELRLSDLGFSANDISELFNRKLKIKLSSEDAISLESRTEGWIAGLKLAALSMQNCDDIPGYIRDLKGDNRYIIDYLVEEVLKYMDNETKEFLVQTSLLEQMSAPLCDLILNRNDSQLILEKLERNNMFIIPLDDDRTWYRYHHLFAKLMMQKLQQRGKDAIKAIHVKACEWYLQNSMPLLAIEHSIEAKSYNVSIELLGNIAETLWKSGQHAALMRYGERIPGDIIKTNADFCLYYSWILINAGQTEKAQPFLENAENITKRILSEKKYSDTEIAGIKILWGKIAVAHAYLESYSIHCGKIFQYCEKALDCLNEKDPFWFSWAWFTYGIAYTLSGDISKSMEAFDKAYEHAGRTGNVYLMSTIILRMADIEQQLGHYRSAFEKCSGLLDIMRDRGLTEIIRSDWKFAGVYLTMSYIQFMWGQLDKAYENVKIINSMNRDGKDLMLEVSILMVGSMVLHRMGDLPGCEAKIREAENMLRENRMPPYFTYMFTGLKLSLFTYLKQYDKARRIIKSNNLAVDDEITFVNETAYMTYARFLLADDKPDEAEFLLSKLDTLISATNRIERLIDIKILYYILSEMRQDHQKAVECLAQAMKLASGENILSPFLFGINFNRELLKEISENRASVPASFLEQLKHSLEKKGKVKKAQSAGELSARELETLKLLAEDLSNQEIADKLFVSLNTTKTHIRNILIKLDAKRRSQAVSRARELGII